MDKDEHAPCYHNPKEIDTMSATTEDPAETKFTNSLSGYLNNHLAGETLGLRRASSEHEGERLGTFLLLFS